MSFDVKKHFLDNSYKWLATILSGFFLFFVLYFYKGFNIQQDLSYSGHGFLFRTSMFGLLTSFSFFIHEFLISSWWKRDKRWQKAIWLGWEIFASANLTFLLFNYFWNGTEFYFDSYSLLLGEYFSVMIFPLLFAYLVTRKLRKSKNKFYLLTISSDNGKHLFKVHPDLLLCLKAEDNYVEVYYLSENVLKTELIRNTLKSIEDQFKKSTQLVRSHRGYLVNPSQIQSIKNHKGQMTLDLGHGLQIPVSKNYMEAFEANEGT